MKPVTEIQISVVQSREIRISVIRPAEKRIKKPSLHLGVTAQETYCD